MYSISRFLKYWRINKKDSLETVSKRAKEFENPPVSPHPSYFWQVENGKIRVNNNYIEFYAKAYDLDPAILMSFLTENTDPLVHLHHPRDYVSFNDQNKNNMMYMMGKYSLFNSFIRPMFITVNPRSEVKVYPHDHIGEEVIYVLEGEMYIIFPRQMNEQRLRKGDVIHFFSNNPHYMENRTSEAAEAFVVRLLLSQKDIPD